MKTSFRHLTFATLAVALAAGCDMKNQSPTMFAGPAGQALSVIVTASPDLIARDGGATSIVRIVTRDHQGQILPNVPLRLSLAMNGQGIDCGTLSTKSVTTNSAGLATVTYTAPSDRPCLTGEFADTGVVNVFAQPIGDNFSSTPPAVGNIGLYTPGVIGQPNGAPTASFLFSPSAPNVGDDINFDASASVDSDGTVALYEWNWGDGDSDTTTNPRIQKDYATAGTYTVRLVVVDNQGRRSAAVERDVVVGDSVGPEAVFAISPTNPVRNESVHFDASESSAPDGRTIVEYRWNFGDGTTQTTSSPRVTKTAGYANARTYSVTLVVVDSSGRTSTRTQTLTVAN